MVKENSLRVAAATRRLFLGNLREKPYQEGRRAGVFPEDCGLDGSGCTWAPTLFGKGDRSLHSVPDSDVGAGCTSGRDVRGRGGIACGGDAAGPVDSILP